MRNSLICVLISILAFSTKGQNNFVKSYVITEKGDTIKGEAKLNPKKEVEVYEKIYFKDTNGVQKTYRANKIKGFGVGDENFISLDNSGEPSFYKVLAAGEINLYKIVYESVHMNESAFDSQYFISKPDNKKLVVVKQNKFKKQISDWMKDNEEFIAAYEDKKTLDEEKAVGVISQYNAWKAGK